MGLGRVELPTSRLSGDELGIGKSDEMPSFPRQLAHSAGIPSPENRTLPRRTDTVTDTVQVRSNADPRNPIRVQGMFNYNNLSCLIGELSVGA